MVRFALLALLGLAAAATAPLATATPTAASLLAGAPPHKVYNYKLWDNRVYGLAVLGTNGAVVGVTSLAQCKLICDAVPAPTFGACAAPPSAGALPRRCRLIRRSAGAQPPSPRLPRLLLFFLPSLARLGLHHVRVCARQRGACADKGCASRCFAEC